MKKYVLKELEAYYQLTNEHELPACPEVGNLLGWETLKDSAPSSLPCLPLLNVNNGQATCTLGRFQVNSLVSETNMNATSYGTIMGCASKYLMDSIKTSGTKKLTSAITFNTQLGCHLNYGESQVKNSLKHFLELEHCVRVSDMCYVEDFCIHPRYSVVRSFKDQESAYDTVVSLKVIIWVFVVIGIMIAVLTFAGIKYNA
jgi:hypothetical protein